MWSAFRPSRIRSGLRILSLHYIRLPVAINSRFNIRIHNTTQNASSVSERDRPNRTIINTLNNMLWTKDFVLSKSFKNSRAVILSTLLQELKMEEI
jgi:hypothetical protein